MAGAEAPYLIYLSILLSFAAWVSFSDDLIRCLLLSHFLSSFYRTTTGVAETLAQYTTHRFCFLVTIAGPGTLVSYQEQSCRTFPHPGASCVLHRVMCVWELA